MSEKHYTGGLELDVLAENAPQRNAWVEKLLRKHLINHLKPGARILEFGAGKGEFLFRLKGTVDAELLAVELDPGYREELNKHIKTVETIDQVEGMVDAIYLTDVLEHIRDDYGIMKSFYEKLNPGGRIFIYVPARMELFSDFDRGVGHFRRYSIKTLKDVVNAANFKIETVRYHEFLGYFAAAANKFFGKDGKLDPRAVKIYDSVLVPLTNGLERIIPVPFGKKYLSGCSCLVIKKIYYNQQISDARYQLTDIEALTKHIVNKNYIKKSSILG